MKCKICEHNIEKKAIIGERNRSRHIVEPLDVCNICFKNLKKYKLVT
jgi:hypothetical protein